MKIEIIKCLQDNYSYLIIDEENQTACVIDPSESAPIINYLDNSKINLKFILNTHHHYDHVGGNIELKKKYNSKVVGFIGDKNRIPEIDISLEDNQIWKQDNFEAKIYHVPGHTSGHIAFHFFKEKKIFTGDTLFSLGCGRIFEGTYEQMYNSLKKIKSLPKFQCGLAGHVPYEAGLAKEKIKSANPLEKILPNLFFGLFDIVIAFDNKLKKAYLFSINLDKEFKSELSHQIRLQNAKNLYSVPRINNPINKLLGFQWKKDFDKRKYISKINKILNYIKNGDIFQANFTQRFLSKIPKDYDVVRYYLHYRKNTAVSYTHLTLPTICSV